MIRVLDLFSGIGGFSLGLEKTGSFETVAFCEIDMFAKSVLSYHWQEVPVFDDITTADFSSIGPVDLVTGGFPCQDASLAGKGAGLAGNHTGLFWHIIRTIRLVGRPKLLLENVAALLGRGMGEAVGAMAQIGYDAEWNCIPAAAVGAPHSRDRLWIFAYPSEKGLQGPFIEWDIIRGGEASEVAKLGDYRAVCGPEWAESFASISMGNGLPNRLVRDTIGAAGNSVVPKIPEMIGMQLANKHR